MSTQAPLPTAVQPAPDETLPSLLLRVAHSMGTNVNALASNLGAQLGRFGAWIDESDELPDDTLVNLAAGLGAPTAKIRATVLAEAMRDRLLNDRPDSLPDRMAALHAAWIKPSRPWACGPCLEERNWAWRAWWHTPFAFMCTRHHRTLAHVCPRCDQPLGHHYRRLVPRPAHAVRADRCWNLHEVNGKRTLCEQPLSDLGTREWNDDDVPPSAHWLESIYTFDGAELLGEQASSLEAFQAVQWLMTVAAMSGPGTFTTARPRSPREAFDHARWAHSVLTTNTPDEAFPRISQMLSRTHPIGTERRRLLLEPRPLPTVMEKLRLQLVAETSVRPSARFGLGPKPLSKRNFASLEPRHIAPVTPETHWQMFFDDVMGRLKDQNARRATSIQAVRAISGLTIPKAAAFLRHDKGAALHLKRVLADPAKLGTTIDDYHERIFRYLDWLDDGADNWNGPLIDWRQRWDQFYDLTSLPADALAQAGQNLGIDVGNDRLQRFVTAAVWERLVGHDARQSPALLSVPPSKRGPLLTQFKAWRAATPDMDEALAPIIERLATDSGTP